jgi:very-short-patch-repair endonuclease
MPRNRSTLLVCHQCGQPFFPHYGPDRRYCSRPCANAATAKPSKYPIPRTCAFCGRVYELKRDSKSYLCSRICAKRHAALTRQGEAHPLWKPKTLMRCEVCGAEREVKPSLVARFRACSRRCASALARMAHPRTSSLETSMAEAIRCLGLHPEAHAQIGPYQVDFAFRDVMLVVECDGTYWHSLPKQQRLDHSKDAFLTNRGWRVLRLSERIIKMSASDCARAVLMTVMALPPSEPQALS